MNISYFILRLISKIIARIFFKNITVIGIENFPAEGPVVLCATHNSQFVDAMMLIYAIERPVNFIIAASSTKNGFLKYFLKLINFIPTERPIDHKRSGNGFIISIIKNDLIGEGTKFLTDVKVGETIKPENSRDDYIINQIISDTQLSVTSDNEHADPNLKEKVKFSIFPKIDQKKVFANVSNALAQDKVVGIFPEGGSHDQTKLLPLKAGACIFVWSSETELNKHPSLLCSGINYFGAHRFRSKVIIKFSKPIEYQIDKSKKEDKTYKKEKIADMMESLKESMEDVKFLAPSFNELINLYVAQKLYIPADHSLTEEEKFIVYKKFCDGYELLKDKPEMQTLMREVNNFRRQMKNLGLTVKLLRDPRTRLSINWLMVVKLIFRFLSGLPFLLFMFPIRILLTKVAEAKRQKALKSSFVKIRGNDVLATWKIFYSFIAIPAMLSIWNTVFFLFCYYYYHNSFWNSMKKTGIFMLVFPFYLYFGVFVYDGIELSFRILYANLCNVILTKIDKKDRLKELQDQALVLEDKLLKLIKSFKNELSKELQHRIVKRISSDSLEKRFSDVINEEY